VKGLCSDRIQPIVRSTNRANFDEIAETALEDESVIVSKNEKYRKNTLSADGPKCSNCNKIRHVASRRYLKDRKDARVNQVSVRNEHREPSRDVTCYNSQGAGHMAKQCKKPKKRPERQGWNKERSVNDNRSRNEYRPSESSSRPTVQFTQ
jgi:hypothetical protein